MNIGDTVYVLTPILHNVHKAVVKDIDCVGCLIVEYVKSGSVLTLSPGTRTYTTKEQAEKEAFIMRLKGG